MKKIIKAGNNTVPKILAMSKQDYINISGFKEKLATKIDPETGFMFNQTARIKAMQKINR